MGRRLTVRLPRQVVWSVGTRSRGWNRNQDVGGGLRYGHRGHLTHRRIHVHSSRSRWGPGQDTKLTELHTKPKDDDREQYLRDQVPYIAMATTAAAVFARPSELT